MLRSTRATLASFLCALTTAALMGQSAPIASECLLAQRHADARVLSGKDKAGRYNSWVHSMTQDNINVLMLGLAPVTAVALLVLFRARRSDWSNGRWKRQMGFGVLGVFICACLFPGCYMHACGNGQPNLHLNISLLCIAPVILFVRQGRTRIVSALLMCLVGWLPANHYVRLVHRGNFIGTTRMEEVFVSNRTPVAAHSLWHSKWTHLYRLETTDKEPPQTPSQGMPRQSRQP